jgi:predicted GNAT family acetyltransferase
MGNIEIINNENHQRFESKVDEEIAFIEYRYYKGDIAFTHTFVPQKYRGKGISSLLAKYALEYAKEKNLKIMVYCPFIAKYIKDHPEYEFLIDKKYRA